MAASGCSGCGRVPNTMSDTDIQDEIEERDEEFQFPKPQDILIRLLEGAKIAADEMIRRLRGE